MPHEAGCQLIKLTLSFPCTFTLKNVNVQGESNQSLHGSYNFSFTENDAY